MRILLLSTLLCGYISATSTGSASSASSASSTSSSKHISSSSVKKKSNSNSNNKVACNLNEPWSCKEYPYYDCHTCINNVCFFTEYAFLKSGEFNEKMTHHCQLLPFDCNYFHETKECHTRFCPTKSLCASDDNYDLCLFKAILCYDAYCEPDLSALPFDYRLYDLCCNIHDIDKEMNLFHTRLVIVLGAVTLVIFIVTYQIYTQFKKYSLKKLCNTAVKKLKYVSKYVVKNWPWISMKIIRHNFAFFYNEVCKKCKKLKRNIKYQYKNNKMMWCFFNLFDECMSIPFMSFNYNPNNGRTHSVQIGSGAVDILLSTDEQTIKNHHPHTNSSENNKKKSSKCRKKRKIKAKKRKKSKSKRTKHNHNKDRPQNKEIEAIICTDHCEEDSEGDNNVDVDECDDEKDLSDTDGDVHANELSITMVACPFCACMNAQYLSYCDQCKKSLTPKDSNSAKIEPIEKLESHKKAKKNKKPKHKKQKHKKKKLDYWTCAQCTYHNQGKFGCCQMCASSKNEAKFSTKCTKKSKKKKNKKNAKKRVSVTCAANPKSVHVAANSDDIQSVSIQSKPKNALKSLNPNAKEFILNTNTNTNSNCNIQQQHNTNNNRYNNNNNHYNNYHNNNNYGTYPNHSPSRRLTVIPRLQIAVNPEPDYSHSPRHHTYRQQEYNKAPNHNHNNNRHIPPRFHVQSPPLFTQSEGERGERCSDPDMTATNNSYSKINISLIAPILPPPPTPSISISVSANALSQIPATDLQKQLSDMEANVQEQLQVLDTLFPAIKPDLTQEIQSMQQNIAMNNI